jgi:hypothetical protein
VVGPLSRQESRPDLIPLIALAREVKSGATVPIYLTKLFRSLFIHALLNQTFLNVSGGPTQPSLP